MSRYGFVGAVAAFVVGADQLTKWVIRSQFGVYESVPVVDGLFSITHVRNTGGAFSLFAGTHEAWRVPFFLTVAVVAVAVLLHFVRRVAPHQRVLLFALGAVLGGAVGNMIDRAAFGEVTDFLDVYWRGYHWPTFNVADSFITVGMLILIAHSFVAADEQSVSQSRTDERRTSA